MVEKKSLLSILRASGFGKRTAEEEREHLSSYFVETEQWTKVINGSVDIVYGPKGSGKSAIYSLIINNENNLFDRSIIVAPGENPQGAPAFQNLNTDPPANEFEFVSLWKLYILTICGNHMRECGFKSEKCDKVISALEEAELIPSEFSLSKALKYVFDYVKGLTRLSAMEGTLHLDQNSGLPTGVTGKISLSEPTAKQSRFGVVSVDELFRAANEAFSEKGYTLWVLLDRLDVAFADRADLEKEALRALFKAYLDIRPFKAIQLKIFLRTDIWARITEEGFREASHIERSLTIKWKPDDLMNLVVRRLISNADICDISGSSKGEILVSFGKQQDFFYKVVPNQVESGPNKPTTFNWILSRTRDAASDTAAPREVIHFLNELRDVQIARLERGVSPPAEPRLFEQVAFKEALPAVSKARLEQTLYAEYPLMKPYVEALREQKATQNLNSLRTLWGTDDTETLRIAGELETIGFFERTGNLPSADWSVPFLYRPSLSLIQGSA